MQESRNLSLISSSPGGIRQKRPGKDAQIDYVISAVIALLSVLSHLKVFPLQFRQGETRGLAAQSDVITKRHYQGEAPKGLELQL